MRRSSKWALTPAVCLLFGLRSAKAARAEERPTLRWTEPVRCMHTPRGDVVRVQCDGPPSQRRCLVAPNQMEGGGELSHVQECSHIEESPAYQALVDQGRRSSLRSPRLRRAMLATISARVAGQIRPLESRLRGGELDSELPEERREPPSPASGSPFGFGRGQAETGLHISSLSTQGRSRHDFRILEGTVTFKDLEINGLLFAYDYQHMHRRPAYWLSTFFGTPRVYPVSPPLGWGFRVLAINDRPPAFRDTLDVEFAEAHAAWDPWQSSDLYSHVRVEAGADLGEYWEKRSDIVAKGFSAGTAYAGFSGAVRSRFSLGRAGSTRCKWTSSIDDQPSSAGARRRVHQSCQCHLRLRACAHRHQRSTLLRPPRDHGQHAGRSGGERAQLRARVQRWAPVLVLGSSAGVRADAGRRGSVSATGSIPGSAPCSLRRRACSCSRRRRGRGPRRVCDEPRGPLLPGSLRPREPDSPRLRGRARARRRAGRGPGADARGDGGVAYRQIESTGEGKDRIVWQIDHRFVSGWIHPCAAPGARYPRSTPPSMR